MTRAVVELSGALDDGELFKNIPTYERKKKYHTCKRQRDVFSFKDMYSLYVSLILPLPQL